MHATGREYSGDLISFTHLWGNNFCLKHGTLSDGDIICCVGKLNEVLPMNIVSRSVTLQIRGVEGFDAIVMVVMKGWLLRGRCGRSISKGIYLNLSVDDFHF